MLFLWKVTCTDPTGLNFVQYFRGSKAQVQQRLATRGWRIREMEKESSWKLISAKFSKKLTNASRVPTKSLVTFYRQLSNMQSNGVSITRALEICAYSSESTVFRNVCRSIAEKLESGEDLASAMAAYPNIFDRMAATTIRASMVGGYLDKALLSLANSALLTYEINKKLNGASIYPMGVLSVAIFAVLIFAFKVIPNFVPLYDAIGADLPLPTQSLLWLSEFLKRFPFLAVIIACAPTYVFIKKKEIFSKTFFQYLFHKLPIVRPVVRAVYLARFLRMISQLTEANIPFPTQMVMLEESSTVTIYRDVWKAVKEDIEQGEGLSESLHKHRKILTVFVTGNIYSGEKSGTVAETTDFIADFYEDEVKDHLKNLNSIIEPFLIIILAGLVGWLLFAMFLPLFDVSKLMAG
jgi:type IV pilus assembly protein PilC